MHPKVSINIVTFNGERFLPDLLKSIANQTFQDFVVRVIDNGSSDNSISFIKNNYPQAAVLRNVKNLGFTTAHNQGIRFALDKWPNDGQKDKYVLVVNQDTILEPDFIECLVQVADRDPTIASLGGKMLKLFEENILDEYLNEKVKSDVIDTTGIITLRSRRMVDRGAGEKDVGQFDEQKNVFGISGAIIMYRASALAKAKIGDEYFDEDFFMYKEDVDMAWRFLNLGFSNMYVPKAIAYHYRGAYGKDKKGIIETIKNRMQKPKLINYWSFRNHWYSLLKNDHLANILFHLPFIAFYESKKVIYVLLFEQGTIPAIFECLIKTPKMFSKRRVIMSNKQVGAREIRQWFR